MPSSSHPRWFGVWVEVLLLIGVVVVVGLGVVVLNTRQVDRATDVAAEGELLQDTVAPSAGSVSPSPQPNSSVAQPQPAPSDVRRPEDPYTVGVCADPICDLNVLVEYAPTIVRGTVTQVHAARWSTPDGTHATGKRS